MIREENSPSNKRESLSPSNWEKIYYKCQVIPSIKGTQTYTQSFFPKQLTLSSKGKNRLRHQSSNRRASADPFGFLFLQRSPTSKTSGPAQQFQHAPAQFRLKKHHQFGAVCGNGSSFTNKVDLSVTDGINSEYKQEPRKSPKDARPARQCRQPTSCRRAGNYTR